MKKMKYLIVFLLILIVNISVYAASYRMNLSVGNREVDENATVDVKLNLNSIQGIDQGLSACSLTLSSSGGVTINNVSGKNSWNVTRGGKVVLDSSNGATSNLDIATINVTVSSGGTLSISGVMCTDGDEFEEGTSGDSITFTIKEPEPAPPETPTDNNNTNNNNGNSNNNSNNNGNSNNNSNNIANNNNNSNNNTNNNNNDNITNNNDPNPLVNDDKKQEEENDYIVMIPPLLIDKFEIIGYSIDFNAKNKEYTINVADNVNKLYIVVEGNGLSVKGDKEISIVGKDKINVEVSDNNTREVYTINIERNNNKVITTVDNQSGINYYIILIGILIVIVVIETLLILLDGKLKRLLKNQK